MSSQTQDSPIDDGLLSSSTGAVIVVPDDMVVGSPLPGWSGRFFHAVNMTFSLWEIAADASDLHSHRHPYEEVWTIIEGEIDLTIDGQVHTLVTGSAAIIPPDVSHAAAVRGACKAYVADHPRREHLPGVLRPSRPHAARDPIPDDGLGSFTVPVEEPRTAAVSASSTSR